MRQLLLLFGFYSLVFWEAKAQPFSAFIDSTFGVNGISADADYFGQALRLQPDGKILVLVNSMTDATLLIKRYLPDGSADTQFGQNGVVDTGFKNDTLILSPNYGRRKENRFVLQADGKILLGFNRFKGDSMVSYVQRYLPDGIRDQGFGQDGQMRFSDKAIWFVQRPFLEHSIRLSTGKYVLIYRNAEGAPDYGFRFLNADGSLNQPQYNIQWNGSPGNSYIYYHAQVQQDDRLLLLGAVYNNGLNQTGSNLIRLEPDGTPDYSYGFGGNANTSLFLPYNYGQTMTMQPDGKCLAMISEPEQRSTLVRMLKQGTPDTDFGVDGRVSIDSLLYFWTHFDVETCPDERIIVAGDAYNETFNYQKEGRIIRLLQNGKRDSSFNGNGVLTVPDTYFGGNFTLRNSIVLPDRRILLHLDVFNTLQTLLVRLLPEPDAKPWYRDLDGDGYGSNDLLWYALEAPDGYVAKGGDCADYDENINPGAPENCNGIDDNCDGIIDENLTLKCNQGLSVALNANGAAVLQPSMLLDNSYACNAYLSNFLLSTAQFTCADIGAQLVAVMASNSQGASANCVSSVHIVDNTAPVATCNTDHTVYLQTTGAVAVSPAWFDAGSTDNCSAMTFSVSPATVDPANLGLNPVVLTVTDPSGNSSTCVSSLWVLMANSVKSADYQGFELSLSPNPATEKIGIRSRVQIQGAEIFILDIQGKIIKKYFNISLGDMTTHLDIQDLQPGIYMLQVFSAGRNMQAARFIKTH